MISHKYKAIFIHIPKCAGSSIENLLQGSRDHFSLRMLQRPIPYLNVLSSAENLRDFLRTARVRFDPARSNRLSLSNEEYETYFKFAFIRNPWSRCYSWYRNVIRDQNHRRRYGIASNETFESFLPTFIRRGILKPQTYWLVDYSGNIGVDYIGRFENLEEDFKVVRKRLGLNNTPLPHTKNGMNDSYIGHYTKKMRDLVGGVYAEEIEMFGYRFE